VQDPRLAEDPTPLSRAQIGALISAAGRELVWGLRSVSAEIEHWRQRALDIDDSFVRKYALRSLASKRGHIDGAALFWILAPERSDALLRLLVAYDVLCDYLDSLTEHCVCDEHAASQLHLALTEALDPAAALSDYFRYAHVDDDGYLRSIVGACRAGCATLPSYARLRPLALREAARAQVVLPLNHIADPALRDAALQEWARREFPDERELRWFELTAAASTWLAVQCVLALAANPGCDERAARDACRVYFPWCSLAGTMLDSYVDQFEDMAALAHSYIGHYLSPDEAVARLGENIRRAARAVRGLKDGELHAVIFACMVAMYLSKASARAPELREATRTLARAGGSLTTLLLPVLRLWRILYRQRML
jgi:tetraprenyl-beta-curcumene synthase